MGFLIATAFKDLRRRLADRLALAISLGLPALLGALIILFLGDGERVPTARVAVVNQDDSLLSRLLTGALEQGIVAGDVAMTFELVDLGTGRERIDEGAVTALLIVPPAFGQALVDEEPTTLTLWTNPAEPLLAAAVTQGLELFGEAAFYAQRLLEDSPESPQPPSGASADASDPGHLVAVAADRLSAALDFFAAPLFRLETGTADVDSTGGTQSGLIATLLQFILPGMILMSMLFIAQGTSDEIWREKDDGTARRLLASPRSGFVLIAGKLLSGLVVMAVAATAGLAIAALAFDLAFDRIPLAVAWCLYTGTALLGLFLLIAMLGPSHRTNNLVTMMLLFPLMVVGGSFSPFEAMPGWMRAIGVWTPNGIAVEQLGDILFGSVDPGAAATASLAIGAIAAASLTVCLLRARRFVTA